jgi:hypothetical protein
MKQSNRAALAAQNQPPATDRAGYSVADYCPIVGYSRPYYYLLSPDLRPKSIKLGKRRIIIEAPRAYLERLAAAQEAATAVGAD